MAHEPDPDAPDDDDTVPARTAQAGTAGDVDEVIRLLTWARVNGYAIPQLAVGSVTIAVKDMRPRPSALSQGAPSAPVPGIWSEYDFPEAPQ